MREGENFGKIHRSQRPKSSEIDIRSRVRFYAFLKSETSLAAPLHSPLEIFPKSEKPAELPVEPPGLGGFKYYLSESGRALACESDQSIASVSGQSTCSVQ